MKRTRVRHVFALLLLVLLTLPSWSQRRPMPTATLLKGPTDWRLETMPVPPGFAPDIKFKGFEEARFAPGMFDTTSSNYWTYVLVVSAEGSEGVDVAGIKDFLEKYYQGLMAGAGRRKKLSPGVSQMKATVTPAKPGSDSKQQCDAQIPIFDTFNDGRKVVLNLEIGVVPQTTSKKTCLVLLISPQAKDHGVWKKLREIRDTIKFEK
jgi:hypothetical protein